MRPPLLLTSNCKKALSCSLYYSSSAKTKPQATFQWSTTVLPKANAPVVIPLRLLTEYTDKLLEEMIFTLPLTHYGIQVLVVWCSKQWWKC